MSADTTDDFTGWVAPHLVLMGRYARRLVAEADVDDVVQDALERAWRRWSTYDESRGGPVPWLLAIVADRARRRRVRARWTGPWRPVEEVVYADPPDVDLERAVRGLSMRQRTAVTLYYFVDLDIATVAEVMECAPGTVQATLHQARARLREMLGDGDE
jgi:RNA polymerase sigma-70 factor (ECF subfamily)